MTKMSQSRKAARGIATRNLNKEELNELKEVNRVAATKRFEVVHLKNNTALVPDGQKYLEQLEGMARLLENIRDQWTSAKLAECGWPPGQPVSINLETGEITLSATPTVK